MVERGEDVVELGSGPGAVVLRGLTAEQRQVLRSLELSALTPDEISRPLWALLDDADLLEDAGMVARQLAELPLSAAERAQLGPDLVAAGLTSTPADGGVSVIRARRAAVIEIRGLGRVGAVLANLLRGSGVGTVRGADDDVVTNTDVAPGGHQDSDVGEGRLRLLQPAAGSPSPHLVVVVEDGASRRLACEELVRASQPHLIVSASLLSAVVGPLVLPGATACRRCVDCARGDRDREWAAVAASEERLAPSPPPVLLAVAAAAVAAGEVLAWVEGRTCASVNATLELGPTLLAARRSWTTHPRCGCRWSVAEGQWTV
ncbi:MAG: hypothetical protein ACTHNT_09200 [Actinomycetales bacterium]